MKHLTTNQLLNKKENAIKAISQCYPLSEELLKKYQSKWDWEGISDNHLIDWNITLLEKYQNRLLWKEGRFLNFNTSLPWSPELIRKFIHSKKWTWDDFIGQEQIFQEPELLALCLPEWNKNARQYLKTSLSPDTDLGMYKYFEHVKWADDAETWAPETIEKIENMHWDLFSGVEGFPWTVEFIEKHKNRLDWKRLSWNGGLPWNLEFIKQFKDKWDWNWMSYDIPWTIEIIDAFKDHINWNSISNEDKIDFLPELATKYPDKVQWAYPNIDFGSWEGTFSGVINSEQLLWTPEFYQKIKLSVEAFFLKMEEEWNRDLEYDTIDLVGEEGERVYWTYFAKGNNWSVDFFSLLLQKEKEDNIATIDWNLICEYSKNLWTDDFIEKHQEKLKNNLGSLVENMNFPWDKYKDLFLPNCSKHEISRLACNIAFTVSIAFLKKYKDDIDWWSFSRRTDLEFDILEAFADSIDWTVLTQSKEISIELLQKFPKHVSWNLLSSRNDLDFCKMDLDLPWCWDRVFACNKHLQLSHYLDEHTLLAFLNEQSSLPLPNRF